MTLATATAGAASIIRVRESPEKTMVHKIAMVTA